MNVHVLLPWIAGEAIPLRKAADIAGCHPETVRLWCVRHYIGRRVAGRWMVSHPALMMMLESNRSALKAYLAGDRKSDLVKDYFDRAAISLVH